MQKIREWAGTNEEGLERLEEGIPVYRELFNKQGVIDASCADYRAGAGVDCEEQTVDQEEGRKLEVPVLVVYSKDYLGKRYDVGGVWKEWVADESLLRVHELGNEVGHFMPEEDPVAVTEVVVNWMREVLKIQI